MLLSRKVNINRVVSGTWKEFFFILVTAITSYLIYEYLTKETFMVPGLLPSVLGTALSFFIGFNNNQAYNRWWEARKIWGALVNDSRTWARKVKAYVKDDLDIEGDYKTRMVHNHIAFVIALKENLRGEKKQEYLKYLDDADTLEVQRQSNKANAILGLNNALLKKVYDKGGLDGFGFMACNNMLVNFSDEMGKSERIKNTVFPTTYNYYTKMFTWIFIVGVTLTLSSTIGIRSVIVALFLGYVFLVTHKIGDTLLNPFEDIPSGVSIGQIARTIEINMLETIEAEEVPAPVQSVNGEYIM